MEPDLNSRGLKLYVTVPAHDPDFDYKDVAAHSDGLILMNYDQHYPRRPRRPIAGQDWFDDNLQFVLKDVPRRS